MSEPSDVLALTYIPSERRRVRIVGAFPLHLAVSRDLLRMGEAPWITHGDGMLRLSDDEGRTALYGYAHDATSPSQEIEDYGQEIVHYDLIRAEEYEDVILPSRHRQSRSDGVP